MWKLLFYNGKAPAPQAYFMTILGSGALFFILLTSAIDAIESNMAVRNIRLYDWAVGKSDIPPTLLLMPLTNA